MNLEAQAVFHIAKQRVELRSLPLPPPQHDQVLVKTRYSAISPGTEGMIFEGRFPQNAAQDATIKSLSGNFRYPFRYGYALAGEIIAIGSQVDKRWLHKKVFAFHPHQTYALVALQDCVAIPEQISMLQAILLPNTESAVNFVMDAAPLLGENVLVMGQGIVGLLTTALLHRFPLSLLITADRFALRRDMSLQLGAMHTIDPEQQSDWLKLEQLLSDQHRDGLDLVFELSGNIDALNQAIALTGFAGRILIGSWYGTSRHSLDLSSNFHRRRIRLLSSQVSTVDPVLAGRWDKARRLALVWDTIGGINPEHFITHRFTLHDCREAFECNSNRKDRVIQVIFEYND